MGMLKLAGLVAGIGLFAMAAGGPVAAAPQILAVLPSDSGVPFTCTQGQCRADLSTYCLQQNRPAPSRGTVYLPAAAEDFALVIKTPKGERTVAAAEHVSFVESRGFMAVTALIDQRVLENLSGLEASLRVGTAASLLPEAIPFDPNPLTEKEIAYVTKWRRDQGTDLVDSKPQAKAAQLLAGINNRMPRHGTITPSAMDNVWEQTIGDELTGVAPATAGPAINRARMEFMECREGASRHSFGGVRSCLEFRHDDMIRDLNIDYWNSRPGS